MNAKETKAMRQALVEARILSQTREARLKARKATRAKEAREKKLKTQVDSWFGSPLRDAISTQNKNVADVTRLVHATEIDLTNELRSISDRVTDVEASLQKTITDVVHESISSFRWSQEKSMLNLERQYAEASREMRGVKDKVVQLELRAFRDDFSKQALDSSAAQVDLARRIEGLEATTVALEESRFAVEKLMLDFENYSSAESQREAHTRRLEFLIKDMEERLFPWRPRMDRSSSPTRCEQRTDAVTYHMTAMQQSDDRAEWLPWPTGITVKASPSTSCAPSCRPTPRPTPPTSRPSSARFRGRDPGSAVNRTNENRSDVQLSNTGKLDRCPSFASLC